ncbi:MULTISPECIES: hypothetical protein [unclassified Arthrobacter]|uniref:hypothetical protein n=1 Tax=unclassified Arthrobacter TaxID=235627 RepID=UPI00149191C9|nr:MULTISPECIES: hypothetical protein [unclassified Arthrobacter]MBE0010966.1 hypothetical protein [Arthrobacter sp. AET 35A]NOJ64472.1 hypothetical protein [Arthrobacter sp. 147(2020)]
MATTYDDVETRSKIALWVCLAGVTGIAAISIVLLTLSTNADRPKMARLVFASVLPLLGTWIGTIFALYFAKDNLQAANNATLKTLELSGTFTPQTKIKDVMTPLRRIDPLRHVTDKASADAFTLVSLYEAMQGSKNSRIPILTQNDVVVMVIHEPDIDKYAQIKGTPAKDLKVTDTLGSLRNENAELKRAVETFVAVAGAASVGEARDEMNKELGCKDVFVTDNGKVSGKVIGWLTNSDLARIADR